MKVVTAGKEKIEAAADTLEDLASAAAQGKPGLPEPVKPVEEGKPGLPEPDPEPDPEYMDYSEEDDEEEAYDENTSDEEEKEPVFTEKDRKDLPKLEQKVTAGNRQAAEAIREIRQRQLWRLIRDDEGKQLYANFEAYCQERHGHARQWVTHQTNWLWIEEERERLGIKERLSVKAAQGLLIGRLKEAGGLGAVLEEAKEDGVPLDRDHLREIVIRRAEYNHWSKEGQEGATMPAAKTYAEYKKDLATVEELGDGPTDYRIIAKARELDGDFADNLVALCQAQRVLPQRHHLLTVLTGKALEDAVGRLNDVATESAEIEEKKERLKALKKQLKEGQKKEKDEKKALEQELEAKGVIGRKKNGQPPPQTPQDGDGPDQEDSDQEPSETEDGEIYSSLATALEYLDEALTSDWADEDEAELNRILLAAQDCETKLAEIMAKAKELLADPQEPKAVPSGND